MVGVHATAINSIPNSALATVSDHIPENLEKLTAQRGSTASSTDRIIADPVMDVVLIATSADTRSDLIEQVTQAGKAVLFEKTVTLSLAREREPELGPHS
ncbi:Gfo/Idh/MocA family oxidoreductase [Phaeobacter italicus]|uniref:Gfo/Idh/MocA family oxidoreductase n=1 Tax=Phaeobacter italicus TaxID=481446 RepID=UPI00233095BB|nr:Gfo/Idh/MocA family oxidoreductase [Phaeobacter italicus]